jgi:hypothetical protein
MSSTANPMSSTAKRNQNFEVLSRHVAELALPHETKLRLVGMVIDAPPHEEYDNVNDAIHGGQIMPGMADEKRALKLVRLALWALVYFPGQPILIHRFLCWSTGERIGAESPKVEQFTKDYPKLKTAVDNLELRCVGLLTQRKVGSRPETCNAFRLTCSGNDYTIRISRAERSVQMKIETLLQVSDPARCLPTDCSDPEARQKLINTQKNMQLLTASNTLGKFLRLNSGDKRKAKK